MLNQCPEIGTNVKFVNSFNKKKVARGIVTNVYLEFPEAGSLNEHYLDQACWVRLENGVLIKDVTPEELTN